MTDFIYDIESYPNIFTLAMKEAGTNNRWLFEISDRRNDLNDMMVMMYALREDPSVRMVGFNNIGYDWIIVQHMCENANSGMVNAGYAYNLTKAIIQDNQGYQLMIWPDQRWITQLDLFKIHHFDNKARGTSLKALEFQMHLKNIQDLPFPPGTILTSDQMDSLIDYNINGDVEATERFYWESQKQIKFREDLSIKYNRDCMNDNDTKIGKEYFITALETQIPGICYNYQGRKKIPRQTIRFHIPIADVIFPTVKFEHPEFQRILTWIQQQTLTSSNGIEGVIRIYDDNDGQYIRTKSVFEGVNCNVDGFQFDFGLGGIHGSVDSCTVLSDRDNVIIDLDVASYYPNLAIANRIYPEHLSESFCDIYKDVYEQRKQHPKKTPPNDMLKLALNGVYGDSNNRYSPFYDPKYTMTITINGQLLLCILAEQLMKIDGLKMIQINTDGLTVKLPRDNKLFLQEICMWWENLTGLVLEDVDYERMHIRDVNHYIGVFTDGKLKKKGVYQTDHPRDRNPLGWHQDTSMLVVSKVAEDVLVRGANLEQSIINHADNMDFMLRAKVNRKTDLFIGETEVQRTTRYTVTNEGGSLYKIMPPTAVQLKKNPEAPDRKISINKGWLVKECNCLDDFNRSEINYNFYIQHTRDIVDPILKGGII